MRLRMHAIIRLEERSGEREQLAVGRMIKGLDAGDLLRQSGVRLFYILRQFRLGVRRSGNQYRSSVRDGFGDVLEKFLVQGHMSATARVGVMMDVLMGVFAADAGIVGIGRVELEYLGFAVIDPDQYVIMLSHGLKPTPLPGSPQAIAQPALFSSIIISFST